jgi:hypothetical protein
MRRTMTRAELMEKAEAYIKKNGFPPGVIYIRKDAIMDILQAYRETVVPKKMEVIESLIKEGIENLEKIPLMGMAIELKEPEDQQEPIVLGRSSGRATRIKPQGMKEAYMPVADITNSMSAIMKASYAFFDDVESDEAFCEFAKHTALLMHAGKEGELAWSEDCLPNLQKMCEEFVDKSENAQAFFIKFFMCVIDFYWHSCRLIPGEELTKDRKEFNKAMDMSALLRTMPKEMREEYLEHVATYGTLSEIVARRRMEED